ncbi:MAG TPA: hypothetical protein VGE74_18210, partial [Gemmata sp.]
PKIPWPNLQLLLGLGSEPTGNDSARPESDILGVLATAFADRLEALTSSGLVAGYGEAESVSTFLRGRLRAADQMRDAAARAFPGHFHINEPVFDLDTPWNRIAKSTADALAGRTELPLTLRERIASAALPLAPVAEVPATEVSFAEARADPRAVTYGPLLDVCRTIHQGLMSADPHQHHPGAFLIDLGHVFECHLVRALQEALRTFPGWQVEAHPGFALGPVRLHPDLVLRKGTAARVVLDAKWKATTLDAADLHQVLAYATLTGARRVGLVYPGRTDARTHFMTPDGRIRVTRYRIRVVGSSADLAASISHLARDARRR